jgi:ribose/xylose/arabinose/galactoside ABC-type transport system permease subunit
MTIRLSNNPHIRPFAILLGATVVLALLDRSGRFLSIATAFSTLQTLSITGLVALGLGLSMMIRNFDISVVGVFSLAGCIAVMTGGANPWIGVAIAVGVGVAVGFIQGLIVVVFRIGSVGVTLGGLLICVGLAHVLTENRAVPYDSLDVSLAMSKPLLKIFSIRSLIVFVIFFVVAAIISFTRLGRDVIATGSDRQSAAIAGVAVDRLTIAVLTFSGFCAALSGVLLAYSLASASPSGLSDVIVPAAAAAILGGVSLGGGTGRPLGILAGALVIATMRSGLNAIGGPPSLNDIAMGTVLFIVAVVDGRYFLRRFGLDRRRKTRSTAIPGVSA